MWRRKSKMLHGICDLLRGECEMPHEIGDFAVEMRNAAQNLGFPRQKKGNAARNSGSSHGEFEIPCGISIFCPERTKIRSGFAILSLAAAKSPYHAFQTAARFPEFEGAAVIYM